MRTGKRGTFTYSLLVLRAVRSEVEGGGEFVPRLASTLALALAPAEAGAQSKRLLLYTGTTAVATGVEDYYLQGEGGDPPASYTGRVFKLSQNYPDRMPPQEDYPWLAVRFVDGVGQLGQARAERTPGDRDHLGLAPHRHSVPAGLLVPRAEHDLALAGLEIEIAAQHQVAGRRHHVLALLVAEDRVRQMRSCFQQHMRDAALGSSARGEDESGGYILRTLAEMATEEELKTDIRYLQRVWETCRERIEQWKALARQGAWREFVERLLVEHYDPAYRRSSHKNFSRLPQAQVVRIESADEKTWSVPDLVELGEHAQVLDHAAAER